MAFATTNTANPTFYRVDIYDEQDGTWSGIAQLQAGETPFTTEEDNSDDFFAPIRTQSGTLQVCTRLADDSRLTLDDILPPDNVARPLKLINLSNNNAVEWQGFLSCEAYSQNYTEIPENLSLPVISVLEAMDSVQADMERLSGFKTVAATINNILEIFIAEAGVSYFTQYYIPSVACGRNIMSKYIDNTILFDTKEYNNENSTTYIVDGLSLKGCLERIATYMGWCVRENNISLFFMAANESVGYNRKYRQRQIKPSGPVVTWMADLNDIAVLTSAIANFDWMGTDHKRDIRQGAKSVEVVAKLDRYSLNISIPDCPVGSLYEVYGELSNGVYLYLLGNTNTTAYSNANFSYYYARFRAFLTQVSGYQTAGPVSAIQCIAAGPNSRAKAYNPSPSSESIFFAGAFLAKYCWEESSSVIAHDVNNALYCVFFPSSLNASWTQNQTDFDPTKVGPIYSISNITSYRCNVGYLRLSADADTIFWVGGDLFHTKDMNHEWLVAFELKFGNKWWNGSAWQNSQCTFNATMFEGGFKDNWDASMPIQKTSGLLIPITENMSGIVTLKIWPMASEPDYGSGIRSVLEMIFSSLDVEHVLPENATLTDRGENHYFRLLGTNFRDDISIDTDLASSLNNQPSPSLIMDDETTPMTTLNYGTTQSPDMRRPEIDLLDRLASYYSAARQTLSLITKHPIVNNAPAVLPLLKLNGINDGKTYLPLAESRDWRTEECTLTCFEAPETPSES